MPTDADDTDPWKRPLPGFQRRADTDAPRGERDFGPGFPPPPAPPGAVRRGTTWTAAIGLTALAVGVGIGAVVTRMSSNPSPEPRFAEAEMAPAAQALPVEVVAPPPSPTAPRAERLEVLPDSPSPRPLQAMAPSPPAPPLARTPSRPPAVAAAGTDAAAYPALRAAPDAAAPPVAARAPARAAAPPAERLADGPCGWAQSPAQRMVCEDRGLSVAHQRMQRAYADALGAGVSREDLEADQADWRQAREEAARYSRRAVASVYNQRIEELEEMAGRR